MELWKLRENLNKFFEVMHIHYTCEFMDDHMYLLSMATGELIDMGEIPFAGVNWFDVDVRNALMDEHIPVTENNIEKVKNKVKDTLEDCSGAWDSMIQAIWSMEREGEFE